jgi:TRAP-type C4-dicarboxylate transport system permease small subunit
MIRKLILSTFFIIITVTAVFANQTNIETFPSTPYDRYIIYQILALFWAGIIGLIVIIGMKLKEIERIQKMGPEEKEEKEIPLLD